MGIPIATWTLDAIGLAGASPVAASGRTGVAALGGGGAAAGAAGTASVEEVADAVGARAVGAAGDGVSPPQAVMKTRATTNETGPTFMPGRYSLSRWRELASRWVVAMCMKDC